MHDQESITRMSGADFIALTGSLSVGERDDALSYLWGAHPGLLAAALNWAAHQQELRTARAVEAKRLPDPPVPEPVSPEEVAALAGSIAAGTPLVVTDDRCECGHPARVHNFAGVGRRGFCHECDAGACKQYRDAGDVAVTA